LATAYTADQLRTAIRERIGYDSTTVIGDTELLVMLNDVVHDVWDILIQSDTVATFGPLTGTTTANTREYLISDGAGSTAYRIKRMALVLDGYSYPLETFELGDAVIGQSGLAWGPGYLPKYRIEHNSSGATPVTSVIFNPPPSGVYTYEFWYNPLPPVLASGSAVPFSSRFPVGEYIILECAIRCKRRLRIDTSELMADRDRYLQRIEQYYQPEQRERAPLALRTKPVGWSGWRRWP
jgi:hypothetical protein